MLGVRTFSLPWASSFASASFTITASFLVDGLDTLRLEQREMVFHVLEYFRRMPLPRRDLSGDAQRLSRAV